MDPYLQHPAIWHDVHQSLVVAIADDLSQRIAPHYYTSVASRKHLTRYDPIITDQGSVAPMTEIGVAEVFVPMRAEVSEWFLEIREVSTRRLVTVLEVLSPANKAPGKGREDYEAKRFDVLESRTNLVEIDLLRGGEPMDVVGPVARSDYRILVARRAQLYHFGVRQPIPAFPVPLLPGDSDPLLDLTAVLHALYARARFDMRLDYAQPAIPPLVEADAAWARAIITGAA